MDSLFQPLHDEAIGQVSAGHALRAAYFGQAWSRPKSGLALKDIGINDDAINAFEEAQRLDPENPEPAEMLDELKWQ